MAQVLEGRQKQWVSFDFTGVPNPIAKEGIAPNEMVVVSQFTRGLEEQDTARVAAIAAINTALGNETQSRIAGDTLAEERLQQAIEGVSKRTVADRYEGTTAPTPALVPGVNTTLPATDWHSWFLWDQGAASPDTGIYYFLNNVPTRVSTVAMTAGLLVYNDAANTFWLMIDDAAGGASDFVPFGRSSDMGSTPPIYTSGNTIRLAFENDWLATRVNPGTGETELTIAQSFRDRISSLEVDVDDLQARLTANEQLDGTQSGRLSSIEAVNASQDASIGSLTTRVTTSEADVDNLEARMTANEQLDTSQDNRLTLAEGNITTVTNRVTTAEGDIDSVETNVATIVGQQVTQDTAIADLQATKQTAQQVLDAIVLTFSTNNPIKTLTNGVSSQVQRAGTTYTQTTFTIEMGQADFARTRFSENVSPFSAIAPPDETYPGTTYIVNFLGVPGTESAVMNADGSVKNGVIDVWFHKGFR